MPNPEERLIAEIQGSLLASDEHNPTPTNLCILPAEESSEIDYEVDLLSYRRLAVFGSYALSTETVVGMLSVDESVEDDREMQAAIRGKGQEGLEILSRVNTPQLCSDMRDNDLFPGDIAKGMLDGSVKFLAGVAVYEAPEKTDLVPALAFNSVLEDTVFGVREIYLRVNPRLPKNKTEVREMMNPSMRTRMAYAIEAAVDLLPSDISEYSQA